MENPEYHEMYVADPFNPTPKKKGNRKKAIILAICLAAVLILALSVTLIVLSRPKTAAKVAVYSTAKEVLSHDLAQVTSDMMRGGSIEVEAKGERMQLSGKLYLDAEHLQAELEDLSIRRSNQKITASAALGLNDIWFKINNDAYGIASGGAEEAYLNSKDIKELLNPKSDIYRQLQALCKLYDNEDREEFAERLFEEISLYNEKQLELYLEYAEIERADKRIKLVGGRQECRVITLHIDNLMIQDVADEMLDYLEDSDSLYRFMYDYEEIFIGLLGGNPDRDDLDTLFEEYIEKLRKNNNVVHDYSYSYTVTLAMKKMVPELLALSVEQTYGVSTVEIFSVRGDKHGLTDSDKLEFSVGGEEISFEVKEDSFKTYTAKIAIDDTVISYTRDKKSGDFELTVPEVCKISGTLQYNEKEFSLEINKISLVESQTSQNTDDIHISVTILAKDEMPKLSTSYTDLLDMKERDWDKFYEKMENTMESLEDIID